MIGRVVDHTRRDRPHGVVRKVTKTATGIRVTFADRSAPVADTKIVRNKGRGSAEWAPMSKLHRLLPLFLTASAGLAQADALTQDEIEIVKPEGMAETAVHKPGRIPWCEGKFTGEIWQYRRILRSIRTYADWAPDTGWERGIEHMCQFADDPLWQRQATYVVQAAMNSDTDKNQDDVVARMKRLIVASQKERSTVSREPTDEERFAFEDRDLHPTSADDGIEMATLAGSMPWCNGIKLKERWDAGRIEHADLVEAALHICQRPNDATWKTKAVSLLQQFMNSRKETQAEAIASLRARATGDAFVAQSDALCATDDKSAGAVQILAGCEGNTPANLFFVIERRGGYKTELARLVWLRQVLPPGTTPADVAAYAVIQPETNIEQSKLFGELASGPLAKNEAARIVVMETFASFRWHKKSLDAALAKNPALAESAKNAFAEWDKLVAERKGQLAKVAAFEAKLAQSTTAAAGCANDFVGVVEQMLSSYGTRDPVQLRANIAADPLAVLVLSRVAICHAIDKVPDAGLLVDLAKTARPIAGPRSFVSYAVKSTNPLGLYSFLPTVQDVDISGGMIDENRADYVKRRGVVGTVTKTKDGVHVEFKKTSITEADVRCRETNKVERVDGSGNLIYRQDCRETGKKLKVDTTPSPIDIHAHFATAIKPGVFILVDVSGAVPFVKSKADDKNILAFYGYAL